MMKKIILVLSIIALFAAPGLYGKGVDLKVLQLNIWVEGRNVPGAKESLVKLIVQTDPDVVLLCELAADVTPSFTDWLVDELKQRGKTYYNDNQHAGVGILSKYKPENTQLLIVPGGERVHAIAKYVFRIKDLTVAAYSTHLDYLNYGAYLSRGYSAANSSKMQAPVTDPDSIIAANRKSLRDEGIRKLINDAEAEIAQGHFVFLGGDLNEPSHLDWQADTKDLRDHRGAVVNWDVSMLLHEAGYRDSYRELNPDPVSHPGLTWPAGNTDAKLERLYGVKDADRRDRIDFVYYYPHPVVKLTGARIVGPAASVSHGQIVQDDPRENFLTPKSVWPSDHKGNLVTFRLSNSAVAKEEPKTSKKLSFAFLTDVHLNRANGANRLNGLKKALEYVKKTDASFILFGGDLVDNSGMGYNSSRAQSDSMFTVFKQTVEASGTEYFPAIGNHDRFFDKESGCVTGDEVFKSHFKNSYYTFERQGIHFFVLNSVMDGEHGFVVGKEEIQWLKQALIRVPLSAPIVVVTHVPVYSIYYPVVEGKHVFVDMIMNYKELLSAFKDHNLKLVLQGHQHLYEEIFSQKVQYITGGAVCANWWSGAFHGTEEGFLLIDVDKNNNFKWKYIDFQWYP
ncbi:MAG: metallophosphoesterase [Prevotellaceae bacterium]|jgi:exonuclease III/UDP-2,3-diacylglucosamine pyrophosphatase LpxH|nr:metallophosphoesterase [Prevotellaceae bacterium]